MIVMYDIENYDFGCFRCCGFYLFAPSKLDSAFQNLFFAANCSGRNVQVPLVWVFKPKKTVSVWLLQAEWVNLEILCGALKRQWNGIEGGERNEVHSVGASGYSPTSPLRWNQRQSADWEITDIHSLHQKTYVLFPALCPPPLSFIGAAHCHLIASLCE